MFQREQEQLYEAILGTLKYQSLDILQVPDKQIVSIARYVTAQFQGVKPHPKSKIQWHANDGRAPDTHAFIALAEQHESASQKRNVNRDIDERFAACNTTSTHTQVKSLTPSNPLKITLFLYSWDWNSCFIDSPLELFFRGFVLLSEGLRADFTRSIRNGDDGSGLQYLLEQHMSLRAQI